MSAPRKGRIWHPHQSAPGSQRRSRGRAFRDSVSCSRSSCAGGVLYPSRRTRRTSRPRRLRRLHNDHKVWRRAFFHKASSPLSVSPPGTSRRRRCPRRVFVRRKPCTARPRAVRACAYCSSRAPSGGGFRASGHRRILRQPCSWRIGRVRRPGLFRGRFRTGSARARDFSGRILDKGPSPCVRPSVACGVRARNCVFFPDPDEAWFPPGAGEGARPAVDRPDVLRLIPG